MVQSRRSRAMLLPLLILVATSARLGVALQEGTSTTGSGPGHHHPPLLDCAPPPTPSTGDDRAFRANLATALGALPSAAAAAPEGFAATRSGRAGRDRAFARGLCFGADTPSSPALCRACLSAAARDVARGCGASRRAGVWRAGCFVAYADAGAASARDDDDDAFRGWFYVTPNTTATPDRACAADRSEAECDRCFDDSARTAAALRWLARIRGEQVLVVGYTCCLRVQISALPEGPPYEDARQFALGLWLQIMQTMAATTLVLTFCEILDNL